MSFYSLRPKRSFDENVVQLVTKDGEPVGSKPAGPGSDGGRDWSQIRKSKPADHLLPATIEWLKSLPVLVRPTALEIQYPRIANLLAAQWKNATACRAYFDDLLTDRRGNRRGFPADVRRALITLREYYYRKQPVELSLLD